MKLVLLLFCLLTLYPGASFGQPVAAQGGEIILFLGRDSINIFFTPDYYLIEDSCADVIRLGHYDQTSKKFKGAFKDISIANPGMLIASGNYNEHGAKEGNFICYYSNGNLQAKGRFMDNQFNGKWEFFYPDGRPKITFLADGDEVRVLHTWNEEGKKMVDNGHGRYESLIDAIVWKGTLVGGQPDGKWTAERATVRRQEVLASERFKLGEFQGGSNAAGTYKDSSRILLITPDLLPLIRAEKLFLSTGLCHVAKKKFSIDAWFHKGAQQFAEEIRDRLDPVFSKLNLSPYTDPLELRGKILVDGRVTMNEGTPGDPKLVSALISALNGLPHLQPAKVDGRPVEQDLLISIKFNSAVYSFSYRFLPIEVN